jgi:hypothetical protein
MSGNTRDEGYICSDISALRKILSNVRSVGRYGHPVSFLTHCDLPLSSETEVKSNSHICVKDCQDL